MSDDERLARLALSRLSEPGDLRIARLVTDLGAVAVLAHLIADGEAFPERRAVAERLLDARPEQDLALADRLGLRFVIPGDAEWPFPVDDLGHLEALQERGGVPLGLWVRGSLRLDRLNDHEGPGGVAIVGSRSSTSYGDNVARGIAAAAADAGVVVVSGAAYGVDAAAHRGAFAGGGPTIAVLACGPDRSYPAGHAELLDQVARDGAVVTETPPGWPPTRMRFLSRNRIIAALARGTVVVEASGRSGAQNTANWASRLSRTLMAVPGPVSSATSEGCHQLIRRGAAALVTDGAEVLESIGRSGQHLLAEPRARSRPRDSLAIRDQQVLDAVPRTRPARVDSIARVAGVALTTAQSALDRMQKKGLVAEIDGGWQLAQQALY